MATLPMRRLVAMVEVEYQRIEGQNVLTLHKKIG
jgi:hypothetical protein